MKELKVYCKANFINKDANDIFVEKQDSTMKTYEDRILNVEELLKFQARSIQKEIYTSVRKGVQAYLAKDELANKSGGGGNGIDLGSLKEVLNEKVSLDMFNTLTVQKANKIDMEMCMRWVDMLHKMINSVATLLSLHFKTTLDVKGQESTHAKQNR